MCQIYKAQNLHFVNFKANFTLKIIFLFFIKCSYFQIFEFIAALTKLCIKQKYTPVEFESFLSNL